MLPLIGLLLLVWFKLVEFVGFVEFVESNDLKINLSINEIVNQFKCYDFTIVIRSGVDKCLIVS